MRLALVPCLAIVLLLSCGGEGGGGGNSDKAKLNTTITLSPHTLSLTTGTSFTFSFGLVVVGGNPQTDFNISWSATGGSITQPGQQAPPYEDGGTYTAPTTPGTYAVTVTSLYDNSKHDTATITVVAAPTLTSFSADSTDLDALNPTATLTPVFANGTGTITPDVGAVTSGLPVVVHPTADKIYTLAVTNSVGTTRTQDVALKVWPVPAVTFTTGTPAITLGQTATLSWAVTGATSLGFDQGIVTSASSGSWTVAPLKDTSYTLTATNPRHQTVATVPIKVLAVPTLNAFTLTPEILHPGDTAQLNATWTAGTGTLTPTVTGFISGVPTPVSPTTTTTYSLKVSNGLKDTVATRTLRVASPGTFTRLGDLQVPRVNPLLAPLPGDKVLVVGGVAADQDLAVQLSAEIIDPGSGLSRKLANGLAAPRSFSRTVPVSACAVALSDGRVLLMGATPELFDPATETFRGLMTPTTLGANAPDRALLLPDGRVLFTALNGTTQIHVFDPATEAFTAITLRKPRYGQALTLLGDGTVLLSGGDPNAFPDAGTCERFDPSSNSTTLLPAVWPAARRDHEAILGTDGRIELWGGQGNTGQGFIGFIWAVASVDPSDGSLQSTSMPTLPITGAGPEVYRRLPDGRTLLVEARNSYIFDPMHNLFLPADNDPFLWAHSSQFMTRVTVPSVAFSGGRILLAGGEAEDRQRVTLFDPAQAYVSPYTALRSATLDYGGTGVALTDGRILISENLRGTAPLLLDPATGLAPAGGSLAAPGVSLTVVALPNGAALAVGGNHTDPNTRVTTNLNTVQRFTPATNTWSLAGKLVAPRPFSPSLTLLKNGSLLVLGGTYDMTVPWGELFDPATGTSKAIPAPPQTLGSYWAAGALPDGRALVAGAKRIFLFDPTTETWTTTPITTTVDNVNAVVTTSTGTTFIHSGDQAQAVNLTTGTCTPMALGLDYVFHQLPLANGLVLLAGQMPLNPNTQMPALALLNPANGTSRVLPLPRMAVRALSLLPDGRVFLLYGDQGTSEILDLSHLLP